MFRLSLKDNLCKYVEAKENEPELDSGCYVIESYGNNPCYMVEEKEGGNNTTSDGEKEAAEDDNSKEV